MDVEYMSIETFNTNKKENLTFEEIKHLPLFRNSFFGLLLTYTIFYVVKRFILGVSRFGYRFLVRVIDEFIIIGLWIFYGFSSYIENEYIYLILDGFIVVRIIAFIGGLFFYKQQGLENWNASDLLDTYTKQNTPKNMKNDINAELSKRISTLSAIKNLVINKSK